VYFASAAPAIRYPNVYGIDMPAAAELIASGKTELEVQEAIGADWLIYQNLEDLISAATEGNPSIGRFECSVFNGEYVTGDVDEVYLRRLENKRNDQAKDSKAERKAAKASAESTRENEPSEEQSVGMTNDT
jgi:amidophosphoribosyltransferase